MKKHWEVCKHQMIKYLIKKMGVYRAAKLVSCALLFALCFGVLLALNRVVSIFPDKFHLVPSTLLCATVALIAVIVSYYVFDDMDYHNQRIETSWSEVGGAPLLPQFLLCLFLPKKVRDPLLGDLEEEYQEMSEKYGTRLARLWFNKQVLTSLWPMIQTAGRNLVKWGFVGWLEEIIRRIAH